MSSSPQHRGSDQLAAVTDADRAGTEDDGVEREQELDDLLADAAPRRDLGAICLGSRDGTRPD
jgi:hypothetical protein